MTVRALPRLYPILDAEVLARAGISFTGFAHELREAGIRFLQYRDKEASDEDVLRRAVWLRDIFPWSDSCLILNDRVALALAAQFDGAHVGEGDMPPDQARALLGESALVGVSTHNERQLLADANSHADYLAIGPVFATSSKRNPDPVIGLDGVRAARKRTAKPLVAIGGISRSNYTAVLEAGADCAAVISGMLAEAGESARSAMEQFLALAETSVRPRI